MYEQKNTLSWNLIKVPIDIEATELGGNMADLKSVLLGEGGFTPYDYVSFRVIA